MQQKVLLINSMEKLINHIVVSKKNQEEIFASLSKNDFKKIISNLQDENQKLRKISLLLVSQLVYNNQPLKEKFCQIMNIPTVPGRIALNTKLCPSSSKAKNTVTIDMSKNIKEVYTLLKQPVMDNQRNGLFWFINFENHRPGALQLQHVPASQPQNIQIADLLDPIDSMVGFVLAEKSGGRKTDSYVGSPMTETRRKSEYEGTTNRLVNNYFKPAGYNQERFRPTGNQAVVNQSLNMTPGYSTDREIGYVPKTVNNSSYKPVSSMVHHEPPYQQINKSMQYAPSPPLNQIKTNTIEVDPSRAKYGGIKLISTATTAAKGREGGKYFQESPLFQGSVTSSNSKPVGFSNGAVFGKVVGRVERGYETLRQKKVIEKYPAE